MPQPFDPSLIAPADLEIHPVERAETIPARWYRDPAFVTLERDAVFARTWQHVAHVSQLREPGDHVTATVAGRPVMVVRAADGRLHGFYNVCRHRGGPIALRDGHADMLKCRYHGWTYRLDGMLRGVPHFNRTELFDKRDYGLVPVRVADWQGLVFVRLDDGPEPVAAFVAGIADRLGPMRIEALRFASRVDYEARCNWKVYVDNYLDGGYHVPRMHPGLFSVLDYAGYRCELHDGWNVQIAPMKPPPADKADVGAVRSGETAYYFWLWPNFMINCYSGVMDTNRVVPLAIDRCAVVFDYYFTGADTPEVRAFIEQSVKVAEQVQEEDRAVCEAVQRGLGSRHYAPGRYCARRENGDHQFHRMLAAALGKA
jgi:choline monooxygenase